MLAAAFGLVVSTVSRRQRHLSRFFFACVLTGVLLPPPYWWVGIESPNKYLETGFSAKTRPDTFVIAPKNPKIQKFGGKNFTVFKPNPNAMLAINQIHSGELSCN